MRHAFAVVTSASPSRARSRAASTRSPSSSATTTSVPVLDDGPTTTTTTRRTDHHVSQTIRPDRPSAPQKLPRQDLLRLPPAYKKLEQAFRRLVGEPGLALLTGEAGVGKTAAIRNLALDLPRPDYLVLYLCDTAVSPLDLYRTLAVELGVTPSHRRAQLWTDIKKALVHLVDERGTAPVVIVDEAQHLSDCFLVDLSGFLNFAFDSRDLLTLWLVGLPRLRRNIAMQQHAPLAMRVTAQVHLDPLDRSRSLRRVHPA